MIISAIIVAAGRGTRAGGGLPKQYREIAGKPVLAHTLAAFENHAGVAQCVVVVHPDERARAEDIAENAIIVDGADSRAGSVQVGLAAVPSDTTHVLIHDGARPCLSGALITRVIEALKNGPAAAPALPVTDALWSVDGNRAVAIQSRHGLARAQTPQGFELQAIRRAHENAPADAADDVAVALAAGLAVETVHGETTNLKITTGEDFARAESYLRPPMDVRTGSGFDVHAFTDGEAVVLCGITIPHPRALKGHSDADVAMHAITDAIYGALADGDIGQHFPPSDPQWKGAASDHFLKHAVSRSVQRGFSVSHLDCTIICEAPKIGPHAGAMRENLARITGVDVARISVKATTSERLGFTGRGEGIAAQATATLVRI